MEHIASQSPKDLTRLVEQISGSLELAADYERTKKEVERAAENATESFNKRRGFAGEIRVFKEQMSEAERFENLVTERVCLIFALCTLQIDMVRDDRTNLFSNASCGSCSILNNKLRRTPRK